MLHGLALLAMLSLLPQAGAEQDGRSALTIKVLVVDADGKPMPVPRHALLISDNPATGLPRRVQTGADGSASVRLSPGNYSVESEQAVTFQGKAYEWTQFVDIAAGRDATLELTAANAAVAAAPASAADTSAPSSARGASSLDADPLTLLRKWQDSVVALWSPTARVSGFVVDGRGLIVTNQRAVGTATTVEVELGPAMKIAGRVVATDPVRDVSVVRVASSVAASLPAVPLGCGQAGKPLREEQDLVAIGVPLRRAKATARGRIAEIEGRVIVADFLLAAGAAGGPVFAAEGHLVGITSLMDDGPERRRGESRVVRVEEICAALGAAEPKLSAAAEPDATPLPVEPEQPFPIEALKQAAQRAPFSISPYRLSSSSYDITFITAPLMYAARNQSEKKLRDLTGTRDMPDPRTIDPLDDFSNWSEYVADMPAVLMVRVTPKLAEGFWTKLARGAAQTQGMSLPPIKRFKPGFGRLQAFCGEKEVVPVHPFKIEQRVTGSDAVYEGLYVFEPAALGPGCGSVRLVLYSEKDPKRGETRAIDAKVLQQVWDDFASYRALR